MSEDSPDAQQSPEGASAEAARERRLRALRELTRSPAERDEPGQPDQSGAQVVGQQSTPSAGAPPPRRSRARVTLWVSALAALVAILIVVGVARAGLFPFPRLTAHSTTSAITSHTIDLRASNISCVQDDVWSPANDKLAILGYQGSCSTIYQPGASLGIVAIYDMASNHLTSQFQPDGLVRPPANSIVQYQNILWSPDGQRLAITFTILTLGTLPNVQGPVLSPTSGGALLTDTSGARTHAKTLTLPAGQTAGANDGSLAFSGEWDVTTGKLVAQTVGASPAVAYQWGANGALRPLNSATPQAVGNPDGAQTFSVWQPGSAQLGVGALNANEPNTLSVIPNLYLWESSFGAWSPDGRYLYAPFSVGRRIMLPGQPAPTPQELHATGFDQETTIAAHDRAFAAACLLLDQNAANQSQVFPSVAVAWRLDGRVLAAQAFATDANGNVTPDYYTVTLYDTQTGRTLAHLSHDAHLAATAQGNFGLLRWSPDGKHLALADSAFNSLTIWTFNKPLA